uniref:Uncharacterized protein n=1 Tax=Romanomermis culicivorax TaxID=13658 RepID=A0A915IUX9_ROMCU
MTIQTSSTTLAGVNETTSAASMSKLAISSGHSCPPGHIDGSLYNLPNCYFRPNTTASSVFVTDAIRACRDFDPRSHLPFYPNATNSSILANL